MSARCNGSGGTESRGRTLLDQPHEAVDRDRHGGHDRHHEQDGQDLHRALLCDVESQPALAPRPVSSGSGRASGRVAAVADTVPSAGNPPWLRRGVTPLSSAHGHVAALSGAPRFRETWPIRQRPTSEASTLSSQQPDAYASSHRSFAGWEIGSQPSNVPTWPPASLLCRGLSTRSVTRPRPRP